MVRMNIKIVEGLDLLYWLIMNHLLSLSSAELQLKTYHVPVKLFKKWNEFLTQYTSVSYEICSTGTPMHTNSIVHGMSFNGDHYHPLSVVTQPLGTENILNKQRP